MNDYSESESVSEYEWTDKIKSMHETIESLLPFSIIKNKNMEFLVMNNIYSTIDHSFGKLRKHLEANHNKHPIDNTILSQEEHAMKICILEAIYFNLNNNYWGVQNVFYVQCSTILNNCASILLIDPNKFMKNLAIHLAQYLVKESMCVPFVCQIAQSNHVFAEVLGNIQNELSYNSNENVDDDLNVDDRTSDDTNYIQIFGLKYMKTDNCQENMFCKFSELKKKYRF